MLPKHLHMIWPLDEYKMLANDNERSLLPNDVTILLRYRLLHGHLYVCNLLDYFSLVNVKSKLHQQQQISEMSLASTKASTQCQHYYTSILGKLSQRLLNDVCHVYHRKCPLS